ncbi:MAG: DNA mismatch repair protein MutS [Chloroflexi bacterium]|nr:DNA mismatch repair protein MutS [Chloroflexota bacterium]
MSFESILFERPEDRPMKKPELPGFFADLNLDQIAEAVTLGKEEYNLRPFFWSALKRIGAIEYRHEVMQELERQEPARIIAAFAQRMHTMRDCLARSERLSYQLQKQRWFLDAVDAYCHAVSSLYRDLSAADLKSRGFLAFREYLRDYVKSEPFTSFAAETQRVGANLAGVDYCVHIKGKNFTVRKRESKGDYSAEVEKTFERFKQGGARDYRITFSEPADMNDMEAVILEAVAQLYPEVFEELYDFCEKNVDFLDKKIADFDREIQFYVAYLEFINSIKAAGLKLCYPEVSETNKEISQLEGFDLALANKLIPEGRPTVCNDFFMKGKERIFVVSGPNQGGKTTFARIFGQSHYLANLGCPVPGKEAKLFLFDRLFTHFEKEETVEDLRSKLEDDLTRIHGILDEATSRSIVIANEILTSTTLKDAVFLSKKVMESLSQLDLLCVWVTFVEELASYSDKAVSMVSMVAPQNPSLRTYKIVRRPPYGLSYAAAIAEKYGLTYKSLKERIK